jgi:ribonuclease HI
MIQLFTDASIHISGVHAGYFNEVGIGAFAILEDESELSFSSYLTSISFKKYLQDDYIEERQQKQKNKLHSHGDTTMAELIAIGFGLKKLNKRNKTIRIYSDSANAVDLLTVWQQHPRKYKYIIYYVRKIISSLNLKIEIMHIKSHCDVYGNEQADKLASNGSSAAIKKYANVNIKRYSKPIKKNKKKKNGKNVQKKKNNIK